MILAKVQMSPIKKYFTVTTVKECSPGIGSPIKLFPCGDFLFNDKEEKFFEVKSSVRDMFCNNTSMKVNKNFGFWTNKSVLMY